MTPVCVIVGAGPGLGMALARRFGQEGFTIALLARSAPKLDMACTELGAEGITAHSFSVDVGTPAVLQAALDQVTATLGAPDVLIYNAVGFTPGPISTISAETLVAGFQASAVGALVAAQQVLPTMRAANRGTIIFTGGGAAIYPIPGAITLSIGKAAIRMIALGLAQELAETAIHVGTVTIFGTVAPGTPFDPSLIAEKYWAIHTGAPGTSDVEVNYR